jgi:hypothetical protein
MKLIGAKETRWYSRGRPLSSFLFPSPNAICHKMIMDEKEERREKRRSTRFLNTQRCLCIALKKIIGHFVGAIVNKFRVLISGDFWLLISGLWELDWSVILSENWRNFKKLLGFARENEFKNVAKVYGDRKSAKILAEFGL